MARNLYVELPAEPNELVFQADHPEAGWFRVAKIEFSGEMTYNNDRWNNTQTIQRVTAVIAPVDDPRHTEAFPIESLKGVECLPEVINKFVEIDSTLTQTVGVERQQRKNIRRLGDTVALIAELLMIEPGVVNGEMLDLLKDHHHLLEAESDKRNGRNK